MHTSGNTFAVLIFIFVYTRDRLTVRVNKFLHSQMCPLPPFKMMFQAIMTDKNALQQNKK